MLSFMNSIFPFAQSNIDNEHFDLFVDRVIPCPIESITTLPPHQTPFTSSPPQPLNANRNQTLQPTCRPFRITKRPAYLSNYHNYSATNQSSNLHGSSNPACLYPISSFLSYHKLCKPHRAFTLVISIQTEPQTFSQVVESQVWRDAMDIKLQALESNDT